MLEWLTRTARGLTDDPLLQLAGAFESALTDVSDRHDDYIGQGLREKFCVGATMAEVFADTSGWATFFVRTEPLYAAAAAYMRQ